MFSRIVLLVLLLVGPFPNLFTVTQRAIGRRSENFLASRSRAVRVPGLDSPRGQRGTEVDEGGRSLQFEGRVLRRLLSSRYQE